MASGLQGGIHQPSLGVSLAPSTMEDYDADDVGVDGNEEGRRGSEELETKKKARDPRVRRSERGAAPIVFP